MSYSYKRVVSRINELKKQYRVLELGNIKTNSTLFPFYAIDIPSISPQAPNILLCAGIHGDEPAGIEALLFFLEQSIEQYRRSFSFTIFPCLNPRGYEAGTRENNRGIDLNRNFLSSNPELETRLVRDFLRKKNQKYLFAWEMHEDNHLQPEPGYTLRDNPHAFYLYAVSPTNTVAQHVIKHLKRNKIPVTTKKVIYGESCSHGIIWNNNISISSPRKGTFDDEMRRYTSSIYTPETPTSWSFSKRVRAHSIALTAALATFSDYKIPPKHLNKNHSFYTKKHLLEGRNRVERHHN